MSETQSESAWDFVTEDSKLRLTTYRMRVRDGWIYYMRPWDNDAISTAVFVPDRRPAGYHYA